MLQFQFMHPPYCYIQLPSPQHLYNFPLDTFKWLTRILSLTQSSLSQELNDFHSRNHPIPSILTFKSILSSFNTVLNNIYLTSNQSTYILPLIKTTISLHNNEVKLYCPSETLRDMILHECEKTSTPIRIIHIRPKQKRPTYQMVR